ncbi:MAG: peptidylprolyl isomerase [Candidatus Diapherotrites archaeon]|nr:peptidylprolyl isomerase [Candidatus Diapherotrites archaeon]
MIDKGDFVKIDYTGKTGGSVFDTSIKEVGEENGITKPFEPMIVCMGYGDIIPGLEEAIKDMKAGEEKQVKVPVEKAYGQRRSELVKLVPLKAFKQSGLEPVPGMIVTLDDMPARVQSVSGGRVRVDFNHELAGKDLEFDIKVLAVMKSSEEKAKSLTNSLIPGANVEVKDKHVKITPTQQNLNTREYGQNKGYLLNALLGRVGAEKVEFDEVFEKK